jgi:hypothetical protein
VTTGTRQKVPNAVKELKERKTSMLKLSIFTGFLAKPAKLYKIMGFLAPC